METVMGFPKSLPPEMRKPHGAGPGSVTVTGMAAAALGGQERGVSDPGHRGRGDPPPPTHRPPNEGLPVAAAP